MQGQGPQLSGPGSFHGLSRFIRFFARLFFQVAEGQHYILFRHGMGRGWFQRNGFLKILFGVALPFLVQVWAFSAWPDIKALAQAMTGGGVVPWEMFTVLYSAQHFLTVQAVPYYIWGALIIVLYIRHRGYAAWRWRQENFEKSEEEFLGYARIFGLERGDSPPWWVLFLVWPGFFVAAGLPFLALGFIFGGYLLAHAVVLFAGVLKGWNFYRLASQQRFKAGATFDPFEPAWGQGRFRRPEHREPPYTTHKPD